MVRPLTFAVALLLLLPAGAFAGTVNRTTEAVTYTGGAGAPERVEVGFEERAYVYAEQGVEVTTPDCEQTEIQRAECLSSSHFLVTLFAGDDSVASGPTGLAQMWLEAHAGAGTDSISGSSLGDRLFGEAGTDTIDGGSGDDLLDGGSEGDSLTGGDGLDTIRGGGEDDAIDGGAGHDAIEGNDGQDSIGDGAGDDAVDGGTGNDYFTAGTGRDTFTGGEGTDRIDYGERSAGVTITLAGGADDGESGESDDVGTEIEAATGGAGDDRITGNGAGNTLAGGGGNDTITGGSGEDRVEGGAGDDTIDTRDGRYDSIDCGEGHDRVYADPNDGTAGCEVAPDADGDGYDISVDCAPNDPKVNPGAGEVPGNPVDEDCNGGALYLRVVNPIDYTTRRQGRGVRFTSFRVLEVQAGDVIELRCKGGRRRGCAFKTRRYTGRTGRVNVVGAFRRRALRAGATLEVRILRENWTAKVQRLRFNRRLKVSNTSLCLFVGETVPRRCA